MDRDSHEPRGDSPATAEPGRSLAKDGPPLWKRLALHTGLLCSGLAISLAIFLSATSMTCNDGPALIHFGKLFFDHGRFARFSDYSAVSDADSPEAMHHQWLAEVALFAAWALLGPPGIWGIQFAVLSVLGLALFRVGWGRLPLWAMAALASLLVASITVRILPRGDFASLAFMAAHCAVLIRAQRERKWTALYGLIPLQLAWINTHPTAFFGIAIAGLFFCEAAVRQVLFLKIPLKRAAFELRHVGFALAGVIVASSVTPYGTSLAFYPLAGLLSNVSGDARSDVFASVREFDPIGTFFRSDFLLLWEILLSAAALVAIANWRRPKVWLLGTLIATSALSILHARMLGFSAVAAALVIADGCPSIVDAIRKTWPRLAMRLGHLSVAGAVLAAAGIASFSADAVTGSLFIRNGDLRTFGKFRDNLHHPWRAVDFVRRNGIEGNCFNNYDVGSFLAFALPEGTRIFIDTQFLYSYDFYFRYGDVMDGRAPWKPLFEKCGIRFVLLKSGSSDVKNLFRDLYQDPRWRLVFLDECGIVFLPRDPAGDAIAPGIEIRIDSSDPMSLLSEGAASDPRAYVKLADFLLEAGVVGKARILYVNALEKSPGLFTAWNNLGVILMDEGDSEGASRCFLASLRIRGDFDKARRNLRKLFYSGRLDTRNPEYERARSVVE